MVCAVVHGVHLNGDGDECYDGICDCASSSCARSYRFAYARFAYGVFHQQQKQHILNTTAVAVVMTVAAVAAATVAAVVAAVAATA